MHAVCTPCEAPQTNFDAAGEIGKAMTVAAQSLQIFSQGVQNFLQSRQKMCSCMVSRNKLGKQKRELIISSLVYYEITNKIRYKQIAAFRTI